MHNFDKVVKFIQNIYQTKEFIPLHEPKFNGNEKKYLNECIDSTFVSSVGKFVDQFENMISEYTGATYAIATVNGTAALQVALLMAGVCKNDEVLTQPLTFIATVNAIAYCNANPLFIDVDKDTMGLSPELLKDFLQSNTYEGNDGFTYNKKTNKRISACVPMHTFGHPCKIDEIIEICNSYNIAVVEDAAESLGSYYKNKHTGTFGLLGTFSFNGNKTITTGGGGMIITNNYILAKKAKHITTTAKVPHKWEFNHDKIGYNYRLPNLNAALGCAQMEQLSGVIENKRLLAKKYNDFFQQFNNIHFISQPKDSISNYWLNAIELSNREERDRFLEFLNNNSIMTRPIWKPMNKLKMYKNCQTSKLSNSLYLEERIVNIPSGVTP